MLAWLVTLNVVTFLLFGFDKWRAGVAGWRVPENTLCGLGALGGWPGGLIGMKLFRHKTAKWSFKLKYTLAIIPFAAGIWAWLHFR